MTKISDANAAQLEKHLDWNAKFQPLFDYGKKGSAFITVSPGSKA